MSFSLVIRHAEDIRSRNQAALRAALSTEAEARVEARAHKLGYSSAAVLASYVNSSVDDWAAEARDFVIWRDAVWQTMIKALAEFDASGKVPDLETIIASIDAPA